MPLEAGDAPLALPLASTGSTFLLSPWHPMLCRLPGLTKSKCSLMESNSSLTNTHPLELPSIAGCWCLLSLQVSTALFFAFWVPERLLQVMECFSSLSSCLPCCLLAPRWSFSDPNADCSALPKRDAKRRGRHHNRLLVSAVHDLGFLE